MNNFVIVGRLVDDPIIEKTEGNEKAYITVAVTRNFKNADGIYETDLIPCILWKSIVNGARDYCHKGDVVGVRGRLQAVKMASGSSIELVAERITFLSSKSEDKE